MRDQAADWLTSLPDNKRLDIHDLLHEFQKRYELSRVAKWKQTANLWKRKQGVDESVDDYIAAMQTSAKRINMPTDLVIDAIIQGLNPEIRLHVLHTGADSIDGILEAARVSEMAHTANTTQPNQIEELATQVKLLVNKISAQTVIDTPRSPTERRVSFSQTAIAAPSMRERSTSPINRPRTPDDNRGRRSSDQSAPMPPGVRPEYRRQSPRRAFDDEPYARRETSFHRNEQSSQRDTQPWRAPQSYTSTSASNATYNRPHHTIERRQHRHQPSAQVTALLLTHVDFVVAIMQWDVVFVPQQICNVSIAQKWAIWPRFAAVVRQLQIPAGSIHARGVHPFALGVRVN
jgi:hypothetical protein